MASSTASDQRVDRRFDRNNCDRQAELFRSIGRNRANRRDGNGFKNLHERLVHGLRKITNRRWAGEDDAIDLFG